MRHTTTMAGALAAAAVVTTLMSTPATAAPTGQATSTAVTTASTAMGTAPACIKRYRIPPWSRVGIYVRNQCGKTMRVKVIVKRGADSPCWTLRNKQRRYWSFIPPHAFPSYQKTVTC
ncbi:hypothetical protein [Nonomuraea sp. NPDC050643]|uniref:hypothetical protein n=1 Tax=Nonomuraea sp. NPDC050643 TaxID=3155660 RepID=UPI0033D15017